MSDKTDSSQNVERGERVEELIPIGNHEVSVADREKILRNVDSQKYKMLAAAVESESEEETRDILNALNVFRNDDVFNSLYYAVLNLVIDRRMREHQTKNEFYYQEMFRKAYPRISNTKIITVKNDGENIPDCWVEKDGKRIPVEVKKDKFGKKALRQLQRYMRVYKCNHGIAVGKKLDVNLESNIEFISICDLEDVIRRGT